MKKIFFDDRVHHDLKIKVFFLQQRYVLFFHRFIKLWTSATVKVHFRRKSTRDVDTIFLYEVINFTVMSLNLKQFERFWEIL